MTQSSVAYRKIGLTGGIGSGKSTVAARLASLGAHVYDADEIARHALDPGGVCYARVIETFGEALVDQDGAIDRKKLAQIVFHDEKQRQKLNEIVHPYVIEELFSRAARELDGTEGRIAVFEVPLLFESGLDQKMDETILVASDKENRIQRVMRRSGMTREQILARMRTQMPEEEKRRRADRIIENNDTEEALLRRVDRLYEALNAGGQVLEE